MSQKKKDPGFEILRSITESDIPSQKAHMESKYEPILKSLRTLEVEEGIEVSIRSIGVVSSVRKLIETRIPRRHYLINGRNTPAGVRMYIIRKQ